jgi:hypothetical protein
MGRINNRLDFFVAVGQGEVAGFAGMWVLRGSAVTYPMDGTSPVARFAREGLQDGTYDLNPPMLLLGREAANLGIDGVRAAWRERYPDEDHGTPAEPAQETLDV